MDLTTALVVAADRGEGFSGPKYAALCGNAPLLRRVLDDVDTWPVDDVLVVLGDGAEEIIDTVDLKSAVVVVDPEWSEGFAAPIRAGLDLLARDGNTARCVLARGDEVGIDADVVRRLLDEHERSGALITVPRFRYQRSWPLVVEEGYWHRLMGLEGDYDIIELLASHPDGVVEVHIDHLPPDRIRSAADLPTRRGG